MPDISRAASVFGHRFVSEVPPYRHLEPSTLYVCIEYATTVHLCACGCGHEVVNALSPTDWRITFDGETVSLSPSVNNSSLACASHYWINQGQVLWCETVPTARVEALRAADRRAKQRFYEDAGDHDPEANRASHQNKRVNRLSRIWRLLRQRN
ncbi:DUF6527 family protein [Mycobacterium sp. TY815]|uniref:DUF6527 family protein n=1 Tax=Mycobacterium sp. TY815 TaxID=3050581 RepID=UPI0027412EC4|nr:DUF6527 family protein [Mycobacterium sp. TY815]MDP7704923.1 DUF6527 family protein [Mycobacterium sp. TY815]